jgi:hypothetical protein
MLLGGIFLCKLAADSVRQPGYRLHCSEQMRVVSVLVVAATAEAARMCSRHLQPSTLPSAGLRGTMVLMSCTAA